MCASTTVANFVSVLLFVANLMPINTDEQLIDRMEADKIATFVDNRQRYLIGSAVQ